MLLGSEGPLWAALFPLKHEKLSQFSSASRTLLQCTSVGEQRDVTVVTGRYVFGRG